MPHSLFLLHILLDFHHFSLFPRFSFFKSSVILKFWPHISASESKHQWICIAGFEKSKETQKIRDVLEDYKPDAIKERIIEKDGKNTFQYELTVSDGQKVIELFDGKDFLGEQVKVTHYKHESTDRKRKSERRSEESSSGKKVTFQLL